MSSLTWLDYSERERQQVMEVIELFREEETRDELGIGTIRDTLSDTLFPGTSTIQTRLRYFLFAPWVFSELEQQRVSSKDAGSRSRTLQGRLCDALKAGAGEDGIIGALAGHQVQRLPSNVYWSGLDAWGIRLYPGSEVAYYQSLDGFHDGRRTNRGSIDKEPGKEMELANWDLSLPPPPDGFMHDADFRLTEAEADYLVDRVRQRAPDSVLRELIDRQATVDGAIRFTWEHPAAEDLPLKPAVALTHARNFSELIHGAFLLYNLILAEQTGSEDAIERYRRDLIGWWDRLTERSSAFNHWEDTSFWDFIASANARVTPRTRSFVDTWRAYVEKAKQSGDFINDATVRQLIIERERRLKGKRARIGDQRAIEAWSGASGTAQLDYRWNRPVRSYLNDLAAAYRGKKSHA